MAWLISSGASIRCSEDGVRISTRGVSKATFAYFDAFAWHRVTRWLLKRHKRITWADPYRRFLTGRPGNRPQENGIVMFDTTTVAITRYRWRSSNIPTPWSNSGTSVPA